MQKIIFPDYMDGSAVPNNLGIEAFRQLTNICKYVTDIPPGDDNAKPGMFALTRDAWKVYENKFLQDLSEDDAMITFLRTYKDYIANKKNYIVSKNLCKALKATSSVVKTSYFPDNFQAYIEIPNLLDKVGDQIIGFFVSIVNKYGERRMYTSYITYNSDTKEYAPGYLNFELDLYENMKDLVESYSYIERHVNKTDMSSAKEIVMKSEYSEYIHVLMNAILYINNSKDLSLNVNQFAKKRSKFETQKKIYTSKPFCVVGSNIFLPRVYQVDSTMVSGHFRWQPHGPGRSLLKHIYIDPHPRHYNKET